MYTIVEKETGRVLYVKFDNEVSEEQTAILHLRTVAMDNPHWNFEDEIFYDKPHDTSSTPDA